MSELFKYENLKITLPDPRKKPYDFEQEKALLFGDIKTDLMIEVNWTRANGWEAPEIKPYGDMLISPCATSLHYGLECFEGMKAFRNKDKIFQPRPEQNMMRMNRSCKRIALPEFPVKEILKILAKYLTLVKDWIPDKKGYSLYIRPTMISTDPRIGVAPPNFCKFYIITCPVAGYFQGKCDLLVDQRYLRAYKGGTGCYKLGGNYAPTILPQLDAKKRGFNQLMWCSNTGVIQEVGTMNIFFHRLQEDGKTEEVVTAPLHLGTILPGVTRDTVIFMLKKWGVNIVEREYYLKEMIKDFKDKRIKECFGTGTAAVICPVYSITLSTPEGENGERFESNVPQDGIGAKLLDALVKIQRGESKEFSQFCFDVEDILKD